MTGAYLRVRRDGSWQNIEVEHLTDQEREEIMKDDPRLMQWLHIVCGTLAKVEHLLNDLEKQCIIARR